MKPVKQAICHFVWNGKPKIKHNTMSGPTSRGGLNLPGFEIINNALKAVWVKRLYESTEDASWSHIPLTFIKHLGGAFLFKCNYDLNYLNINVPIDFYKDVFLIWQTMNYHIPQTKEQILDTHQVPIQAAVETVDVVPINKLSCKMATERLISKTFQPPTAERRMRQANLENEAIKIIYKIPFNLTKDIRLAISQYKIVHQILPTNASLFRDKILQNDQRHLCEQKQTLTHLFISCSHAQTFWTKFTHWWNTKNDDFIKLKSAFLPTIPLFNLV